MIAHGGSLCGSAGGGFLLGLFLGQQAVFLVGAENLVLVVYVLHIALVGIEIPGTDFQEAVPQRPRLKVDEPGGVESGAPVAGFKMQVGAGGTAGRAAQADDIPGAHPFSRFHVAFGQVAIEGFQAVGVAYHHQVAVTSHIVRYAHAAVKCHGNGRSRRIRKINALVPAAMTVAEQGARFNHVGAYIGVQGIYYPQGEAVRNGVRLFLIGIYGTGIPVLRKHVFRSYGTGVFHITVGAVVVQHYLHGGVTGVQRISIRRAPLREGFKRLTAKLVAEGIGLPGIFLGLQRKARTN